MASSQNPALLRPMQERVDELSKTQLEMMRMQREMMGVMLSLSLRLDSALASGNRNQDITDPTPTTPTNFIDLSLDDGEPNDQGKGKGKGREMIVSGSAGSSQQQSGGVCAESNKEVLKAVASLSTRLDQVGKNVDSLLKSVSVLERNRTSVVSAPVQTPAANPVLVRAPAGSSSATPSTAPARASAHDKVPATLISSGTGVSRSDRTITDASRHAHSDSRGIANLTTATSASTNPQVNEHSRKRARVTFDLDTNSEAEVEAGLTRWNYGVPSLEPRPSSSTHHHHRQENSSSGVESQAGHHKISTTRQNQTQPDAVTTTPLGAAEFYKPSTYAPANKKARLSKSMDDLRRTEHKETRDRIDSIALLDPMFAISIRDYGATDISRGHKTSASNDRHKHSSHQSGKSHSASHERSKRRH